MGIFKTPKVASPTPAPVAPSMSQALAGRRSWAANRSMGSFMTSGGTQSFGSPLGSAGFKTLTGQ